MIIGPNGIFKGSPNPNAAKLFQSFCFSREAQQLIIDVGGLRSAASADQGKAGTHAAQGHQDHEGRSPRPWNNKAAPSRQRYTKIFRV